MELYFELATRPRMIPNQLEAPSPINGFKEFETNITKATTALGKLSALNHSLTAINSTTTFCDFESEVVRVSINAFLFNDPLASVPGLDATVSGWNNAP